jgi:hypothetical protein
MKYSMSKDRKICMCTGNALMIPKDHYKPEETKEFFEENKPGLSVCYVLKNGNLLKPFMKKDKEESDENNGSRPKSFIQMFFNI